VVFGMPREALRSGGADREVTLAGAVQEIQRWAAKTRKQFREPLL
jgi:chemotaxis response regulator CheB